MRRTGIVVEEVASEAWKVRVIWSWMVVYSSSLVIVVLQQCDYISYVRTKGKGNVEYFNLTRGDACCTFTRCLAAPDAQIYTACMNRGLNL